MNEQQNPDPTLARLARELSHPTLTQSELSNVRQRLLLATEQATPEKPRRMPKTLVNVPLAFALAAAFALAFTSVLNSSSHPVKPAVALEPAPVLKAATNVRKGQLHTHDTVTFARVGEQPDEIVRLDSGKLTVEVQPLAPLQRFRVVTGDAEVEVHGTAFDIESEHDHLTHVRVLHGIVEVRAQGTVPVFLKAGDEWRPRPAAQPQAHVVRTNAETPRARVAMLAAPFVAEPKLSVPEPTSPTTLLAVEPTQTIDAVEKTTAAAIAPLRDSPGELAFQQGWAALVANDPVEAAKNFEQSTTASHGAPYGEDADYWLGVALARAGQNAKATAAMTHSLAAHARSPRAGETCAMLGWLLIKDNQPQAAKARFEAAAADASLAVRDSAKRGLAQLSRTSAR